MRRGGRGSCRSTLKGSVDPAGSSVERRVDSCAHVIAYSEQRTQTVCAHDARIPTCCTEYMCPSTDNRSSSIRFVGLMTKVHAIHYRADPFCWEDASSIYARLCWQSGACRSICTRRYTPSEQSQPSFWARICVCKCLRTRVCKCAESLFRTGVRHRVWQAHPREAGSLGHFHICLRDLHLFVCLCIHVFSCT